jgi:hypothetical protein
MDGHGEQSGVVRYLNNFLGKVMCYWKQSDTFDPRCLSLNSPLLVDLHYVTMHPGGEVGT